MVLADIVIGILLLLGFYKGFKKGLLLSLASLVGVVFGVYGAIYFSGYVAEWLANRFSWGVQLTQLVAFAITFLSIIYAVSLLGKFLTKVADFAFLGIFNKLFGGALYTLIVAFLISVFFMFAGSFEAYGYGISKETKEQSVLYPSVASLAPMVLPTIIENVKKVKEQKSFQTNNKTKDTVQ